MSHPLLLLPAILCAAVSCPNLALAHGGVYRGPQELVPPTVQAPPPDLPGFPPKRLGGTRIGPDLTLWQYWWEFHKEVFLGRRMGSAQAGGSGKDDARLDGKDRKRILDRLTRFLESPDTSRQIHAASLIAMARIARKSAPLRTFREFLAHPDQERSETAVLAMGVTGLDEAAEDLLALAADTPRGCTLSRRKEVSRRTRAFACYALGLIARQSPDMALQGRILMAMQALASQTLTVGVDIRTAALSSIRWLHFDKSQRGKQLLSQTAGFLQSFIDKDDPQEIGRVRAHAVTAWATLVHEDAEQRDACRRKLIQLIDRLETNSYVQQSAVLGLGLLPSPKEAEVRDALLRYHHKGKDRQARNLVCISLGRMGGAKNRTFLSQPFLDPSFNQSIPKQEIAWRALGLAILEEDMRRADPKHRPDLELTKGIHAVFRVRKDPRIAAPLALVLGILRYEPAVEDIADQFKQIEPSSETAGYLCLALGLMHDRDSQPLIRSVLDPASRRFSLLRQSSRALGLLDDRDAVPGLIRILQHPRMPLSVSAAAARALQHLGDRSTIEILLPLAEDTRRSDLPRALAIVTLGLLADESPRSWNDAFLPGLNYRAMVKTLSSKQGNGILDIL